MPRVSRPEFAYPLRTSVSAEIIQAFDRCAHEDATTVAALLRIAAQEWLARRALQQRDGARIAAVS